MSRIFVFFFFFYRSNSRIFSRRSTTTAVRYFDSVCMRIVRMSSYFYFIFSVIFAIVRLKMVLCVFNFCRYADYWSRTRWWRNACERNLSAILHDFRGFFCKISPRFPVDRNCVQLLLLFVFLHFVFARARTVDSPSILASTSPFRLFVEVTFSRAFSLSRYHSSRTLRRLNTASIPDREGDPSTRHHLLHAGSVFLFFLSFSLYAKRGSTECYIILLFPLWWFIFLLNCLIFLSSFCRGWVGGGVAGIFGRGWFLWDWGESRGDGRDAVSLAGGSRYSLPDW